MEKEKKYYSPANNKAAQKYVKEKQKSVLIRWKKTIFESEIEPAILESGLPLATFIKNAVEEKIKREKGKI